MMIRILGLIFLLLTAGCSTPGKPAFYYTWTQYKTGVEVMLVNEPQYKDGFDGILRLDDKGKYAVMAIYYGGDMSSHFGYVTKDSLESWITMYTDFLKWDPQNPAQPTKFTILDNLSWTHKDYDVEYRFVNGKKLFVINKHSTGNWFVDFSELSMDEANVAKLTNVYIDLRQKLK
ncbi:hypothetical protein [Enterobacter asburiae]|jgi:hypothetical protein|uniref:hypothetical protein n=1 Tax=Enterobacter asburiae TaxID=61645 RepID=UPI001F369E13|nr:hypothetical protein [Enterobacter asburiae]